MLDVLLLISGIAALLSILVAARHWYLVRKFMKQNPELIVALKNQEAAKTGAIDAAGRPQ